MRTPPITVGIDIGTHQVKVVIAQAAEDSHQPPRIIGTGISESRGVKRGYVVSPAELSRSVRAAVAQASGAAQIPVRKAILGIGGEGLDEAFARAEAVVERGDSVITSRDMQKALDSSESALPSHTTQNRRVLHRIPLRWSVDGVRVLGKNPAGMKGMRLTVETLFITCPTQHLTNLVEAVERAGVEAEDIVPAPLAESFVTLNKKDKRVGAVLCDFGAETLSATVFEDEGPISMKVFPTGSADIASDIAVGLKVPLEEAEQLKAGALSATISKKKVDDLIDKRLVAMFKQVAAHLKTIGKDELLPAGIVLTGGAASMPSAVSAAQAALRLPARLASLIVGETGKQKLRDGSWSVAYGLTVWGLSARNDNEPSEDGSFGNALGDLFNRFFSFTKKFLP